jgi:hypothetical protein
MAAAVTAMVVLGQPTPELVPLPTFARLSAPSATVVWTLVAGHLLFRSVDHGETWEQRALPSGNLGNITSMSFVDDQEGWVASAGSPATQCQLQEVAIWHTTDGGGTWQPVDGVGIGEFGCKGEVSFIDSLHGFLDVWGQNIQPVIYWTSDGGATWSPSQPLPDPPGVTTGPAGFELRTSGHVQSFGSTLLVPVWAPRAQLVVYESDDGGATWAYAATAPLGDTSIGMVTAAHWLQLMNPRLSKETTDAGATWFPSVSDYSQAAPVAPEVVFGSPDVGYATVRGRISQTLDGGEHWTTLNTPGTCGINPPCN